MSWFYRNLIRPGLFACDSEWVHNRVLQGLGRTARTASGREFLKGLYDPPSLPVKLWGLEFPNPVGLAAGMDKEAQALPAWECLGFGFCEMGGVTCHAQPGNPAPRMFRIPKEKALINRMGFNNPGAEQVASTLRQWKQEGFWPSHPVGINLGKSKITPLEEAAQDYARSFRTLRNLADFFVVNVSSPNTPNLRKLQDKAALREILETLIEINTQCGAPEVYDENGKPVTAPTKPLLVKVSPDLDWPALDEILELAFELSLHGLVATNTTVTRPDTKESETARVFGESGGLSGAPLRMRATEVIRYLHGQSRGKLPIIGVGGILSAKDAWEKICAGASLVQLYTGLVYEGPGVASSIVSGLQHLVDSSGFKSIPEAVGTMERQSI